MDKQEILTLEEDLLIVLLIACLSNPSSWKVFPNVSCGEVFNPLKRQISCYSVCFTSQSELSVFSSIHLTGTLSSTHSGERTACCLSVSPVLVMCAGVTLKVNDSEKQTNELFYYGATKAEVTSEHRGLTGLCNKRLIDKDRARCTSPRIHTLMDK